MTSSSSPFPRSLRVDPSFTALLVGTLLLAPATRAQSLVPADQAAPMLVKALGFDKGLAKRSGGKLIIGVLTRSVPDAGLTGDPLIDPPPDAPAFEEALRKLDPALAKKTKVMVVPLSAATLLEAEALLESTPLTALYVDGGFTPDEAKRLAAVAEKKCVFGLYRAAPYEGVFALGVMSRNGRVKLMVNLTTSNTCSVDLDPPSLQAAIVL